MSKIIFYFFILFQSTSLFGKNLWLDSVKVEIQNSKKNSSKINHYLAIEKKYINTDIILAKKYNQKAFELSKKTNYKPGIAACYYNFGEFNYIDGNYLSLEKNAKKAFNLNHIDKNHLKAAMSLNLRAKGLWAQGEFNASQEVLFECLRYCNKHKEFNELGYTYNLLGILNMEQKKVKKALIYFHDSEKIRLKQNDKLQLGSIYLNLASTYVELKQFKKAELYYSKALNSHKENNYPNGVIIATIALSDCYLEMKSYSKAKNLLNDCLKENKNTLTIDNQEMLYFTLGRALLKLNELEKAKYYLNESLRISVEIGDRYSTMLCYENLAELYKLDKKYDQALKNNILYHSMKDSLSNIETKTRFEEIEIKYESERKNVKIKKQKALILNEKKQSKRNFWIGFTILTLISLIFILFYNQFKLKKKQELKEHQQLASVKIIQSEQNERMRIARELHDGIGQKLMVLKMYSSPNDNQKQLDLLEETIIEVREISHNLMPEILNLGIYRAFSQLFRDLNSTNLSAIFIAPNELQEFRLSHEKELSIYRIFQEVVSNMIKHSNADTIEMNMSCENSKLLIKIKDNGKGFDTSTILKSKGIGWENVITRAKIINAQINISSSNKGTIVTFTLNL